MTNKKIGLVLSGRGTLGITQIGILKALEELGMKPDVLSGTSSGAIIGAFYAAGYPLSEITEIFTRNSIFNYLNKPWAEIDLLKANEILYRKCFKKQSFKDFEIPLHIAAMDHSNGKSVIYSSGDVVKAIVASSTFSTFYEPHIKKNKLIMSRRLINFFPSEPLIAKCDIVIGVFINPMKKERIVTGMINILDRDYSVPLYKEVHQKKAICDLIIQPPISLDNGIYTIEKVQQLIDIGYCYTKGLNGKLSFLKQLKNMQSV